MGKMRGMFIATYFRYHEGNEKGTSLLPCEDSVGDMQVFSLSLVCKKIRKNTLYLRSVKGVTIRMETCSLASKPRFPSFTQKRRIFVR